MTPHGPLLLPAPGTGDRAAEAQRLPGCYALSKVLEEVMLEQYYIQYGLNGCCLRARRGSWRRTTSSTSCRSVTTCSAARAGVIWSPKSKPPATPSLDHPKASQQTFNVCMNEPVDYSRRLQRARRVPEKDAQPRRRSDQNAVPLHLARQHQSQVHPRLAPRVRPCQDHRRRLRLQARQRRPARDLLSGLKALNPGHFAGNGRLLPGTRRARNWLE